VLVEDGGYGLALHPHGEEPFGPRVARVAGLEGGGVCKAPEHYEGLVVAPAGGDDLEGVRAEADEE
jgi:hypothetical protein